MEKIDLTDEDVAFHEAGHAVITFIEGLPLESISIVRIGTSLGRVISDGKRVIRENDLYCSFIKEIIVANAGFIAVKIFRKMNQRPNKELILRLGGKDDLHSIHEAVQKFCISEDEDIAFKLWAYYRCERLLREAWTAVSKLAEEVLQKREMNSDEVRRCLDSFTWELQAIEE